MTEPVGDPVLARIELHLLRCSALRSGQDTSACEAAVQRHEQDLLTQDKAPRRSALRARFGLSDMETDLLDLLWAQELDPYLPQRVAALYPGLDRLPAYTVLLRDLFCHDRPVPRLVETGSTLSRWRMVRSCQDGLGLRLDPVIAAYLGGRFAVDLDLADRAELPIPHPMIGKTEIRQWADKLGASLARGRKHLCVISGRAANLPQAHAVALATALGLRPLVLHADTEGAVQDDALRRADRLALLGGCALILEGNVRARQLSALVSPLVFRLDADKDEAVMPSMQDRPRITFHIPEPDESARRRMAGRVLAPGHAHYEAVVTALGRAHGLGHADILELARAPFDDPVALSDAIARRICARPVSAGHVRMPQRDWDALVLTPDMRRAAERVVFEARRRYANPELPVPQRTRPGMPVLLYGPPGTGKTCLADVLAKAIGRPVHCVDLASLVSKYIGETSKNLRRVFSDAARSGDILFFDEADALFGKRVEVRGSNDKHSNADANYLLQLVESHSGITLLATNRYTDLDPAFMRRMRHVIPFGNPRADDRQRVWERLMTLYRDSCEPGLVAVSGTLARSFELSPAQIENAMTNAFFIAQAANLPIRVAHLCDGLNAELQKDGQSLTASQIDALQQAAQSRETTANDKTAEAA